MYKCSRIENNDYDRVVFYKSKFYKLLGYRAYTVDEVYDFHDDINSVWKDVRWLYKEPEMNGLITLLHGNSRSLVRKITLNEIVLGYSGIINEAKKSGLNCEDAIDLFVEDISKYLLLSTERYKSGKYLLNEQILKRLQLKITNKTK
jgi:hypothetical protein